MNPFSEDVATKLIAANVTGALGNVTQGSWGVFTNREPKTPDGVVTLYDITSPKSDPTMDRNEERTKKDAVQIRVRGRDPIATNRKCEEAAETLRKLGRFDITSDDGDVVGYREIIIVADPFLLEQDDKDRYIYVATVQCFRQKK